jgi:hypothetical protein
MAPSGDMKAGQEEFFTFLPALTDNMEGVIPCHRLILILSHQNIAASYRQDAWSCEARGRGPICQHARLRTLRSCDIRVVSGTLEVPATFFVQPSLWHTRNGDA